MTCYHLIRSEVIAAGANYVDQEVVVDDQLVTARAWPDHPGFMREFMKLLRVADRESTANKAIA